MNYLNSKKLWLIGASRISQEYTKVLKSLNAQFKVIGRGYESAKEFLYKTGVKVKTGGVEKTLQKEAAPEIAIVAVGIEKLAIVTDQLLRAGTKRILLEKPGGLNLIELQKLQSVAQTKKATVLLGYNRRFYESVRKTREIIRSDGGATSCHFEFTEWSHIIRELEGKTDIKAVWFLANSSHVVDLAFHLCGYPSDWKSWYSGTLKWHPSSSRFSGAGVTDKGVLFSYFADWQAPGRWGLEVLTRRNRLILRPMEKLQCMQLASVQVETIPLQDKLDKDFKPGLYLQTKEFLNENIADFCTLEEQVENIKLYSNMAGYLN